MIKKIGNIVVDILFLIVVIMAIIMIMLSINTNNNAVSSIFGYAPFSIQNKTMEPTIMNGDLVVVKMGTNNDEYEKDDIISYFALKDGEKYVQIHRIVEVKKTKNMISYITQGDGEDSPDKAEVAPGDIIGKYTGTKISKLGSVYEYLNTKNGFLICIIVPLFIFFVFQIRKFFKTFKELKKDEKEELETDKD